MNKDTTQSKSLVRKKLASKLVIAIAIVFGLKESYGDSLTAMETYIAYTVAGVTILWAAWGNIKALSKNTDEGQDESNQ